MPITETQANAVEAVKHETRFTKKIMITGLLYETIIGRNVAVQRQARRIPRIAADKVFATWNREDREVVAVRIDVTTAARSCYYYRFSFA